jgi:NitT/TauT family transport system permease protein
MFILWGFVLKFTSLKALSLKLLPTLMLCIAFAEHHLLPNKQISFTTGTYPYALVFGVAVCFVLFAVSILNAKFNEAFQTKAPLLSAAFTFLILWDVITLKTGLLRLPFFPGPDKVLSSFRNDGAMLLKCTLYSLRLLLLGYIIGAIIGFVTGIFMGWNQRANYWIGPLLKIIGPIPATAWLPIALVAFPSSFAASVFLISLAVWFPVTVMTSSGIANVRNAFFEVARTLGAKRTYLIFKVAVPAAASSIFIGLFMGMGTSFVTLIAAEMLGVKAGLGWYINWAQGWAEYFKVYAALIVLAVLFSGLITLLFRLKDRWLSWQKGLIRW